MVFMKNDPNTKAAGRKGGRKGDKHFAKLPKDKLKKLSSVAGKASGQKRRETRDERLQREAREIEHEIMHDYLI